MTPEPANTSAGGSATAAGMTFQSETAAWFATLMLAEQDASPPFRLPSAVMLKDILAETVQPVDDLKIGTSAGGQIFVQVKTSLSVSDRTDSEFAKVIAQFVRQFRRGYEGSASPRRSLDPSKDRLVLVVGARTPSTVREELSDVLERLRSAQAPTSLAEIKRAMNQSEQRLLDLSLSNIRRTWLDDSGREPSEQEILQIIQIAHVLLLELGVDGRDLLRAKDLLRQNVLQDPTQVDLAWDSLLAICGGFSPRRTGGDRTYFRQELERRGITIRAAPSYQRDIDQLRRYTGSRQHSLKSLSLIATGSLSIKIQRSAVDDLETAASGGHLVVVGRPGAGKSGCLHDFVQRRSTAQDDIVLLAIDQLNADSVAAMGADLGLSPGRSIVEVLENWSGNGVGYFVVDALDAARTQFSLNLLCKVIRDIQERAPRWRVIVSIREYDLQHGREIKRLFSGVPYPGRNDSRFSGVRHFVINSLDQRELDQVRQQAPIARRILDYPSPKLQELLQNPFNLRLACELIRDQVDPDKLSAIHTQIELLDLYWQELIEDREPRHIRPLLLTESVNAMVKARTMSSPKTLLLGVNEQAPIALSKLFSDGVLLEHEGPIPGAAQTVAFSHNILFDYAVARVWLQDLPSEVIGRLAQSDNQDLLLGLRPSLVFAFQRLWHTGEQGHLLFWKRALEFQNTAGMRIIGKIIAATVAAEEYRSLNDLSWLLEQLSNSNNAPQAAALLRYMITGMVSRHEENSARYPLIGPDAGEWLNLAQKLSKLAIKQTAWDIAKILMKFESQLASISERAAANDASRNLLHHALADDQVRRLVPHAINTVILTADTNPRESASILSQFLKPGEAEKWGHENFTPMAQRLAVLADLDSELVIQLVKIVFLSSAQPDDRVLVGGRIFPWSFSKADMLDGARYEVTKHLEAVMRSNPALGVRLICEAMEGILVREHKSLSSPKETFQFAFLGGTATLAPDGSYIWTVGRHGHEAWWSILSAFKTVLRELASPLSATKLRAALESLRDHNRLAVVWNAVLEAATENPDGLGLAVLELLFAVPILELSETSVAAGKLITAIYPFLNVNERQRTEQVIIRLAEEKEPESADYGRARRDCLLGCVPFELFANEEARKRREEMDTAGGPPENKSPFWMSGWHKVEEEESLRRRGVPIDEPQNRRARELIQEVKALSTSGEPQGILSKIRELHEVQRQAPAANIHETLAWEAWAYRVECCRRFAEAGVQDSDLRAYVQKVLLEAASDPQPLLQAGNESSWDHGLPAWGAPSPRIDAAQGLMALVHNSETSYPPLADAIQRLAADSVAAVRYQIIARCGWLRKSSVVAFWQIIERAVRDEERLLILTQLVAGALSYLPLTELAQARRCVQQIYRRTRNREHSKDIRAACSVFFFRCSIWHQDSKCKRYLRAFFSRPYVFKDELMELIGCCRSLLAPDEERAEDEQVTARRFGRDFLEQLASSLILEMRKLHTNYQHVGINEWAPGDIEQLRTFHQLAAHIGKQVYFASGAFDAKRALTTGDSSHSAQQVARFASEATPLLDRLCELEFVDIAYDILQILQHIIAFNPKHTFLLTARLLANSRRDGVQYEPQAADLVVEIIEEYLVCYRSLFKNDEEMRTTLIDVLDLFVEVGWPKATQLTYRLNEVFW